MVSAWKNNGQFELTALIVEDSVGDFELIKNILTSEGFNLECTRTDNQREFVDLLNRGSFDIILSDYKLPGFDAFVALRLAQQFNPDIPFICVSGNIGEETAAELLKQGAVDYVLKDNLFRLPYAVMRAINEAYEKRSRLAAEAALRESEEKFRTVVEALACAVFIYQDEEFKWVNRYAQQLTGYSSQELLQMKFWQFAHPDHRDLVRERGLLRQKGDASIPNRYEFQIITKDGQVRWVDFSAGMIHLNGRPAGLGTAFDITDRKNAEAALQKSLEEKTFLLKEVHHRVKNSLQIVNSVLNLQAYRLQNPEALAVLRETSNRILAMALLHETLYRANVLSRVQFASYVEGVCNSIMHSFGISATRVTLERRVEDVMMDIDQAVSCGLIINELVSNALKHAFPTGQGRILIEAKQPEPEMLELIVSDDGIGMPESTEERKETLGLHLVELLAEKLGSTVEIKSHPGTTFRFVFKLKPLRQNTLE
ncbi:MAG: PAS domain S-box protein [candidate division KSB1 bacterium]|nr:PAS domain S-box protein [candidate division KSB1 bacterium]